ncbi:MAG: YajQ family cyclic di-GMP-binding protein [Nitrospirales bacterium]|nr:MAG: YajQ family cyclic di-GMP-binding protein [Nitrospirales bacterium]
MANQYSFDVVSKVDMQEMKNAVDQTDKEISQRFDFKGSKTELTLKEKERELEIVSDDEYKLNAVIDILKGKCIKRNISLKGLTFGKMEDALGSTVRQKIGIQSGIPEDKAKTITKAMKEQKLKAQAQIQGDHIRVQSKSKDELQTVMSFLRQEDFDIDLTFENYR